MEFSNVSKGSAPELSMTADRTRLTSGAHRLCTGTPRLAFHMTRKATTDYTSSCAFGNSRKTQHESKLVGPKCCGVKVASLTKAARVFLWGAGSSVGWMTGTSPRTRCARKVRGEQSEERVKREAKTEVQQQRLNVFPLPKTPHIFSKGRSSPHPSRAHAVALPFNLGGTCTKDVTNAESPSRNT